MNRTPAVVAVVLLSTAFAAATVPWRARRASRLRRPPASAPGTVAPAGDGGGDDPPPAPASPIAARGLDGRAPVADAEVAPGTAMLHGGVRHTHRAAGTAPRSAPSLVWATGVGGPVEAQVTTSPDEQTLYVASLGGSLTALARADGAVRWTLAFGDRAYSTPCVARDGTIYVGSDARKLLAVSPDGKVKWSFETEEDADTAPVVAADGAVVFAAGRVVYALTPLGHVKWRIAARRKVFTSPAIGRDGRVFFGSQDHHVYAASDRGVPVWSTDLGADVDGAPAVGDDGSVFVGTDGDEIVRLDQDSGRILWRANVGGYVRGTLSVARGGDVLGGVYGPAPRQVRLRAADGLVVGQFAVQGTGAREFGVHGGALEDDARTLLFGAQDDSVYAIAEGDHLLWRFTTGGDVDAPVTLLGDGSVVVGSDDGSVYLLRAR